ncbi:SDR family NAD(P)-dependent oxidoreductase [Paenibacillus segetis]|uniref:Short-chain dehydrogenase n=1 Tax=Paenibacillus segetis TaxID=1325360 RepID=A0ABQ1YJF7_9BACL|nr:SDR family NAD(P)-dependent oxidoreductase [Paenibacillus segetis]GGH28438.1 short-chain dehydrogenase [Paenibacillus segetis]
MRKTAFVTGADHGLGLALVEVLLGKGYQVIAGRYNPAESMLSKLQEQHKDALQTIELDIGNDASVKAAANWIKQQVRSLDLLINNAAILGDKEATITDELDTEEMLQVFNVNTLGTLRVTGALSGLLLNSSDKMIVNISSEAGSITNNYRQSWYAYCMSKAALNMQSSLVYNGLKDAGGQVLVIHPGWVQTYMQGVLDAEAVYTPMQSATRIVDIILDRLNRKQEDRQGLEYVDVEDQVIPW